jgi:hypothetical protein
MKRPNDFQTIRSESALLPAQFSSSVQRLLQELRSEDLVILRGSRKMARWIPAGKGQDAPLQ